MQQPPRIVLASASPRRRDLLEAAGLSFEVVPSSVDEEAMTASRPVLLVRRLARAKALDVAAQHPGDLVLGADTIVVHRGAVLDKPVDADEARSMLARLGGQTHRVVTAVALVSPGSRPRIEHVVTRVRMRSCSQDEVEAWIDRGEPFDKAGAYAIQDPEFQPVEAYEGCYCNVMGLPLSTTLRLLQDALPGLEHAGLPAVCENCPCR